MVNREDLFAAKNQTLRSYSHIFRLLFRHHQLLFK